MTNSPAWSPPILCCFQSIECPWDTALLWWQWLSHNPSSPFTTRARTVSRSEHLLITKPRLSGCFRKQAIGHMCCSSARRLAHQSTKTRTLSERWRNTRVQWESRVGLLRWTSRVRHYSASLSTLAVTSRKTSSYKNNNNNRWRMIEALREIFLTRFGVEGFELFTSR